MEKLISCIVPVYRSKETLKRCLDSILASTYINFELLVIHNGEDDGGYKIATELAKKDQRVKNYRNGVKGLSAARNFGMDLAEGELICFCDADDTVSDRWMEKLSVGIEKHHSDIACCTYRNIKFDSENNPIDMQDTYYLSEGLASRCGYLLEINTPRVDNWGNVANVWSKMFRKSFLLNNNLRFDEDIAIEDFDFVLRCMLCNPSIFIVNEPLYNYEHRNFATLMTKYHENLLECYTSNIEDALEIVRVENYTSIERKLIFSMLASITIGGMIRICRSDATISSAEIKRKLSKFISHPMLPEIYSCYRAKEGQNTEIPIIALSGNVERLFEICRSKSKEKFGG